MTATCALPKVSLALMAALASPLLTLPAARAAQVQLQLSCQGTVLEARGSAMVKRPISKLRFNLGVDAVAASSKAALQLLQERLDPLRQRLKALQVQELRVSSPSVWNRYVAAGKPAEFEASSQVSGQLAPAELQKLISQVGGLPGVRLSPVDAEADRTADAATNRRLLQGAYADALQRAQALAEAVGLKSLKPLQVQVEGGYRPNRLSMLAESASRRGPAPFDPNELNEPTDQLSLEVTFCATP